jgi:quinolinate synthase
MSIAFETNTKRNIVFILHCSFLFILLVSKVLALGQNFSNKKFITFINSSQHIKHKTTTILTYTNTKEQYPIDIALFM